MPYRHPRALDRCENPRTIERFFSYIDVHPGCSCWKWTGHLNAHGYGHFRSGDKLTYAHRFSYALFNNGVPEDLTVDHICGNARCVNPEHLQLATSEDNVARGKGFEKDVETELLKLEQATPAPLIEGSVLDRVAGRDHIPNGLDTETPVPF